MTLAKLFLAVLSVFAAGEVANASTPSRCDSVMFGGTADVRLCEIKDGWVSFKAKWIDDCNQWTTVDLLTGYSADATGKSDRVVASTFSPLATTYDNTVVRSAGEIFSMHEAGNKSAFEASMDLEKNQLTVTSGFGKHLNYPAVLNCQKVK